MRRISAPTRIHIMDVQRILLTMFKYEPTLHGIERRVRAYMSANVTSIAHGTHAPGAASVWNALMPEARDGHVYVGDTSLPDERLACFDENQRAQLRTYAYVTDRCRDLPLLPMRKPAQDADDDGIADALWAGREYVWPSEIAISALSSFGLTVPDFLHRVTRFPTSDDAVDQGDVDDLI